MKIIITETQELWILRRLGIIKKIVDDTLVSIDPNDYTSAEYIDEIRREVIFNPEFHPFFHDGGIKKISNFVMDNYSDYIKEYYNENTL